MALKQSKRKKTGQPPLLNPSVYLQYGYELFITFQKFIFSGEDSLDRYPLKISLLVNPLYFQIDRAIIIFENHDDKAQRFRLVANRQDITICDRRFLSEQDAREAFTGIFANVPASIMPQVWTPFHKTANQWLIKNFPGQSWPVTKTMIVKNIDNNDDDTGLTQVNPLCDEICTGILTIFDTTVLEMFNKNPQGESQPAVKVSLLCNPYPYFLSGAFLVETGQKYRLIVFRRSFLVIDELFDHAKKARQHFVTLFSNNTIGAGIEPEWSESRNIPAGWLEKKLTELK